MSAPSAKKWAGTGNSSKPYGEWAISSRTKNLTLSIFWKLYLPFAGLSLASCLLVGLLAHSQLSRSLLDGEIATLREKTELASGLALRALESPSASRKEAEARSLGTQAGIRITVIRADGTVLLDSLGDPSKMENHRNRPEILQAKEQGFGISRRRSATLEEPFLYVAKSLGTRGFIRCAVPLTELEARLAALRRILALGTGLGLLLALVLGFAVARAITTPLTRISTAALAMSGGAYETRLSGLPRDEIGRLGESLNTLGEEIARRVAAMEKDQARLAAILESMDEGVLTLDHEERLIYCNRTAVRMLDLDGAGLFGRRFWELGLPPALIEIASEGRKSGGAVQREALLRRGGRESMLEVHARKFKAGDNENLVLVLRDVGELRKLERVRRDFVANVSHELKTPLTSIHGYVETLLEGALEDPKANRRFVQKIEAHVRRLVALVQDLLSLARIEASDKPVETVPVDWAPLVEAALQRQEQAIKAKNLEVQVLYPEKSVMVLGETESMIQIIGNLLDNAVKYTPPGGQVRIHAIREGNRWRLDVRDSGIGIPREDRERIFERFYRVDKARSRELGGTGLGLSIVKHRVQSLGGEIRLESEPGQGSCFSVLLEALLPGLDAERKHRGFIAAS